jgi:hypothetical protein
MSLDQRGMKQIEVDVEFLRAGVVVYIVDDVRVNSLLDEVLISAKGRFKSEYS